MKLYNFEKYYLSLARYKILLFLKKVLNNKQATTFIIITGTIVTFMITVAIILYFFIGLNTFLEKVHLEKYRIEEINFNHSKLDLKQFFKK